jgi:hypothetical protein
MTFSEPLLELTDELEMAAIVSDDGDGTLNFDFDGIAWRLHNLPANVELSGLRGFSRRSARTQG